MIRRRLKEEKSKSNRNWLVTIIGTGGLVALIIFFVKYCNFPVNPCQAYLDKIRSKIESQYLSADTQFFHVSTSTETIDFSSKDTSISTEDFFNEIQLPTFYKALDELKPKIIVPVNEPLLLEYLKKANEEGSLLTDKKITGNLITIREYFPEETIKLKIPDVCEFEYKVELLTPENIENLLPRKVYQTITQALNLCSEFQKALKNPLNEPVNLSEIYKCLEDNPEFLNELKKIIEDYETYFKIVDTGLNWLISDNKIYFEKGEYKISGVYAIIIDKLLKEYEKFIRNNPDQYIITCVGFADPSPIDSKYGIKYLSYGYFDPNSKPIPYKNGISLGGERIESFIKGNNLGNEKLSYARAFSGIQYIEDNFNEKLKNDERIKIDFHYKGEGVDVEQTANKYKRRIEVSLTKNNK